MSLPRLVWVSLPVEEGERVPQLFDGDSYIVRRANGEELWANYVVHHGSAFVPCDDEGNEIGEPLTDVVAVVVRGYRPGFGPSCPKAGEAPRIRLVVASSELAKVIDKAQEKARQLLGERFGAAS